ncbi:hypothetical protein HKX48_008971 [Thoreauomyces humboldtii]|nr:hypothetical protein HKX48_008971 [Thoreauomyces humboldtii]
MKFTTSTLLLALATVASVRAANSTCVADADFTNCQSTASLALGKCPTTDLACKCTAQVANVYCYVLFCDTSPDLGPAACARDQACKAAGVNATSPGSCSGTVANPNASGSTATVVSGTATTAAAVGAPSATVIIVNGTAVTTTFSTPTGAAAPPAKNAAGAASGSVFAVVLAAAAAGLASLL